MFKLKTEEELKLLTHEEQVAYAVEKANFEKKERESLTQKLSELEGKIKTLEEKEYEYLKAEIESFKDLIQKQELSIETLGRNKVVKNSYNENMILEKFKKIYKENVSGSNNLVRDSLTIKAFDSQNIHSVESIINVNFPAPGTTGLNSLYRNISAQVLGTITSARPYSKIMDLVTVRPLTSYDLILFEKNITGDFQVSPECTVKPYIRINYTDQSNKAKEIKALWCTSLAMRTFFPELVNQFQETIDELLMEKIPNEVLSYVSANSSPFTPLPGMAINTIPDNFEAIVKVCASIKKAGYIPNAILLSSVAYANILTTLGTDGHYKLQNGSSIVLVGDTIKIGGFNLNIFEDTELGNDEFIVGDFSKIYVGVYENVIYQETDGRVDEETNMRTGLGVNVRVHELVSYFCPILPDATKSAIIKDTFTNVKTLITV